MFLFAWFRWLEQVPETYTYKTFDFKGYFLFKQYHHEFPDQNINSKQPWDFFLVRTNWSPNNRSTRKHPFEQTQSFGVIGWYWRCYWVLPSLKLTANLPLKINSVLLGSKPEAVSFREILLELLLTPPGMYPKPLVNNGMKDFFHQLVNAGFLNHKQMSPSKKPSYFPFYLGVLLLVYYDPHLTG